MQFIHSIKNIFLKLSKLGIKDGLTFLDELRIRITNECSILIIIIVVANWIECVINLEIGARYVLLSLIIPILSLYFNKKQNYLGAKYLLTLVLPVFALFYWILFGNVSGLGFVFFPFILAPLVFFKRQKQILSVLIFNFILFLIGLFYNNNYESILSSEVTFFNTIANGSASVITIAWLLNRFFYGVKSQEKIVSAKNLELEKKNQELLLSNKESQLKTELLGMLAHDLRGPSLGFKNLTKKLNYLIKRNEYDRILEIGNYFEQSSENLFLNLDNLLSWVVSQSKEVTVQNQEFEIKNLIAETVNDIKHSIKAKEIKVLKNIDSEIKIKTDRNMLKIILRNILENAVKYSSQNSSIKIESINNEGNLILKIKDEGKGIEEDLLIRINENSKLETKMENNSHGLGLQICFYFSEKIGAELLFSNRENSGTAVAINIPQ